MNPLIKAIAGLLNCTLVDHVDTICHKELYNVINNEYTEDGRGNDPDDYYIRIDWKDFTVSLCTQSRGELVKTIKFNFKVEASIQP